MGWSSQGPKTTKLNELYMNYKVNCAIKEKLGYKVHILAIYVTLNNPTKQLFILIRIFYEYQHATTVIITSGVPAGLYKFYILHQTISEL